MLNTISPELLQSFFNFCQSHFGIVVQQHQQDTIKQYIEKSCQTFNHASFEDYLQYLASHDSTDRCFVEFIKAVTVEESYFFRGKEQLTFLKESVFPQLISERRRQGQKYLRIWSAGCASGQEILSILMLLKDLISDIEQWSLYLIGTDINQDALNRGRLGIFSHHSMRCISRIYLEQYFTQTDHRHFQIDKQLLNKINLQYLNFNQLDFNAQIVDIGNFDLILCRNVFIYFDQQLIKAVMQQFSAMLVPGAVLMLGPADFVETPPELSLHVQPNNVIYYKRNVMHDPQQTHDSSTTTQKIIHTKHHDLPPIMMQNEQSDSFEKLKNLIAAEQWNEVLQEAMLQLHQHKDEPILLQAVARAYANNGEYQQALTNINFALQLDDTTPSHYYFKALMCVNINELAEAEKSLKHAIFLDRQFVEAHYQLGLLMLRMGEQRQGIKALKNAMKAMTTKDNNWTFIDSPDMNVDAFKALLETEFSAYGVKDDG